MATLVDTYKEEIIADVLASRVPAEVGCFGDLHDHVDANMYGEEHPDVVAQWEVHQRYADRPYEDLNPAEAEAYEGLYRLKEATADAVDAWILDEGIVRDERVRTYLASEANALTTRCQSTRPCPTLSAASDATTVVAWIRWCDPDSCFTTDPAQLERGQDAITTLDEAWAMVGQYTYEAKS
jgi:hypothetical protein